MKNMEGVMLDLFEEIKKKSLDGVKQCLDSGINPNIEDRYSSPALCRAAAEGTTEICQLLIERGARVNVIDGDRSTPLSLAIATKNLATCKLLLENGAEIERESLGWAAAQGSVEICQLLLDYGAKLDSKYGFSRETVLSVAAEEGHLDVCRFLIKKGVPVDMPDEEFGLTPLMNAVRANKIEVVKLLLKEGADVKKTSKSGNSVLSYAKSDAMLELLSEAGKLAYGDEYSTVSRNFNPGEFSKEELETLTRANSETATRENAVEHKRFIIGKLDDVVRFLEEAREVGLNIYYNFNGHNLYSVDVTMDSAYLEVIGQTKAEFDADMENYRKELMDKDERGKAEAKAKIPYWIAEGEKYIPEGLWDKWKECVEIRAGDIYHGMELDYFLDILKAIKSGKAQSKNDVEKILDDQNHSGTSYGIMKSMLKYFSEDYQKLPEDIENK